MTLDQIKFFLTSWKDGVIEIGRVYLEGGDYEKCAEKFISSHYAFDKVMSYLTPHSPKK
ncbi:MAG: hypothetical protein Ct9H90mP13_08620 [Pseudomonadota bacterium]|nr:MAG: hypothetical protein Ct9H90mP13_08620 [Pseudomonadota bacterium]